MVAVAVGQKVPVRVAMGEGVTSWEERGERLMEVEPVTVLVGMFVRVAVTVRVEEEEAGAERVEVGVRVKV